jgi:hypothetical protein
MRIVSPADGVRLTVLKVQDDGGIVVLGKGGVFTLRPDSGAVLCIDDIKYDENLLWALESVGYRLVYA